eukprot:6202757-Pleurochrysis_carterae.AAC.3
MLRKSPGVAIRDSHAQLPKLHSRRMRTRGALALCSSSSGLTACAWPPLPTSTPDPELPRWCAQPPLLRPLPDRGSWYRISIIVFRLSPDGRSRQIPVKIQLSWYTPHKACVVKPGVLERPYGTVR